MGWKFCTTSLVLQVAIFAALTWVYFEASKKEDLLGELANTESFTFTLLNSEMLNYHFAKRHEGDFKNCKKCQVFFDRVAKDTNEFYENND